MITIISTIIGLLGGIYVGARYSDKIRAAWYSIFTQ